MKIIITSDLHYPQSISAQTVLYEKSGYSDQFYTEIENAIKNLTLDDGDIMIIDGDFFWDYKEFAPLPIIPPNNQWNFYNLCIYQMISVRQWLSPKIPLIFIEGNHDNWFDTYLYSENGVGFINLTHYMDFLIWYYKLTEFQAQKVIDLLPKQLMVDNRFEIGKNIYLLRNKGIVIKDTYIYGFPYFNPKLDEMTEKEFTNSMIKIFDQNLKKDLPKGNKNISKLILCLHEYPKFISKFEKLLNNEYWNSSILFWGHIHALDQQAVKIKVLGKKFQNVMPELNSMQLLRYNL